MLRFTACGEPTLNRGEIPTVPYDITRRRRRFAARPMIRNLRYIKNLCQSTTARFTGSVAVRVLQRWGRDEHDSIVHHMSHCPDR